MGAVLSVACYLVVAVVAFIVYGYLKEIKRFAFKKLPGPIGVPFLGNALTLAKNSQAWDDWSEQYGDVYEVSIAGARFVSLGSSEAVEHVFSGESSKHYLERSITDDQVRALGLTAQGVVLNNDIASWKVHRGRILKTLRSEFHEYAVVASTQACDHYSDVLDNGGKVNIHDFIKKVNMAAVTRVATGQGVSEEDQKVFHDRLMSIGDAWTFYFYTPSWLWRFFEKKAKTDLARAIDDNTKMVTDYKQKKMEDHCRCFLRQMIELQETDPELTDEMIGELASELVGGGNETSSSSMTFCILLLAENPQVQERVYEECLRVLGPYKANAPVALDQLAQLEYLERVFRESLRLQPLVSGVARRAAKSELIAGKYPIFAGDTVLVNTVRLGKIAPEVADNKPEAFDPDRWLGAGGAALKKVTYSFGGGARQCPGQQIAFTQMKTAFSYLIRKYRFAVSDGQTLKKLKLKFSPTAQPAEPVYVKVSLR